MAKLSILFSRGDVVSLVTPMESSARKSISTSRSGCREMQKTGKRRIISGNAEYREEKNNKGKCRIQEREAQ